MKDELKKNLAILEEVLEKKTGRKCPVHATEHYTGAKIWVGRVISDGTPVHYVRNTELLKEIDMLIKEGTMTEGKLALSGELVFYNASNTRSR